MIKVIREKPAAILLGMQLLSLIVLPLVHDVEASRLTLAMFSVISMLMAIVVVLKSPALNFVAIAVGAVSILLTLLSMIGGFRNLLPFAMILESCLYFYTAVALIYYMLSDHQVTLDEILAVGATFTLLAWAFAYAYLALQFFQPDAFAGAREPGTPRTWIEMVFLSFTNLSATGLGDVIPMAPYARVLVALEQLMGVGYIGVIVSRFMSISLQAQARKSSKD